MTQGASKVTKKAARAAKEAVAAVPHRRLRLAVVGRPNVGKSTLFNRLIRKRRALTSSIAGTTRDRREEPGSLGDLSFDVIDTGGLDKAHKKGIEAQMRLQVQRAIEDADAVLYVADGAEGVAAEDQDYGRWVRAHLRPGATAHLVVNKAEKLLRQIARDEEEDGWSTRWEELLRDTGRLGFGAPVCVSAEHGEGMVDLYAALAERMALSPGEREEVLQRAMALSDREAVPLKEAVGLVGADWLAQDDEQRREEEKAREPLYLAVLGQPNVGKSTLINSLLGDERLITGPTPGITRDSIAVEWSVGGRPVRLIDTAGVRKWSKRDHSNKLEALSVNDALAAMRSAHVVLLLAEAEGGLSRHDLKLASMVREEGRALVVALNKCDALTGDAVQRTEKRVAAQLAHSLPEFGEAPCISISGKTGRNTQHLLPRALRTFDRWRSRVSTSKLNRWLREVTRLHSPVASHGTRRIRIKFATQARTRPPTFVLFTSRSGLAESYQRLRTEFKLHGMPLRLIVKASENPFKPSA